MSTFVGAPFPLTTAYPATPSEAGLGRLAEEKRQEALLVQTHHVQRPVGCSLRQWVEGHTLRARAWVQEHGGNLAGTALPDPPAVTLEAAEAKVQPGLLGEAENRQGLLTRRVWPSNRERLQAATSALARDDPHV